jgi:hypothetical protein
MAITRFMRAKATAWNAAVKGAATMRHNSSRLRQDRARRAAQGAPFNAD